MIQVLYVPVKGRFGTQCATRHSCPNCHLPVLMNLFKPGLELYLFPT
jgi:hypothetical protein